MKQMSASHVAILMLLAHGWSNAEIAKVMGHSPNTTRTMCQEILLRMGTHKMAHAVYLAMSRGIIK